MPSIDNVTDVSPRVQYLAAASQTEFDYPFPIFQDSDLVVDVDGETQALNTDYTVSGEGEDTGGTVTFLSAPDEDARVTIYRDIAIDRTSDFQQNGPFASATFNDDLDKITLILQQLESRIGRSLRLPITADATDAQTQLSPLANWLSKYIYINANGIPEPATSVTTTTLTQSILGALLWPLSEAEEDAGLVNADITFAYSYGNVKRYGAIGDGVVDDTVAIQRALDVAAEAASVGAFVYLPPGTYKTTAALVFGVTAGPIKFYGDRGTTISCAHNGHGLTVISTNENFGGHVLEGFTINGPNTFLPEALYVPPSTGAGINMNRDATTNAVTSYNSVIRDVTIQGFAYGIDLQCAIGLNVFGGYIQYNQYGVHIDGGQTNANHFFGTHIRYNRKAAVFSAGTTGGSLTNATNNVFHACLIESNIPYPFEDGGTPPTDSVAIYLNNSYDFCFRDCYSENHSACIYLSGGSKGNRFLNHRTSPGGGGTRLEVIHLIGAGVDQNIFDMKNDGANLTDVHVISDNANQLFNTFSGSGVNFIAGSISAKLDYADIKPSQNFSNIRGTGVIRMPQQGYAENVSEGTGIGQIDGIGTASATLNAAGLGEVRLGSGITGATTIDSITGLLPHQFFTLTNLQTSHNVTLDSTAVSGALVLQGGRDVVLNAAGQTILFYVNGAGNIYEVGRNFDVSAGVYTVTNGSADRSLNVTGDTLAQVAAVLGTLIDDLKTRGILS